MLDPCNLGLNVRNPGNGAEFCSARMPAGAITPCCKGDPVA